MELRHADLCFQISRSARRRTLEIVVERDGALRLLAPEAAPESVMRSFVQERIGWIYRKLAEKDLLFQPKRVCEIAPGEGYSYLGRSHRMAWAAAQEAPLRLSGGQFRLLKSKAKDGPALFVAWYTQHAHAWLEPRIARWSAAMGKAPARLKVQDLGHRWASCSSAGVLHFHWCAILLPPRLLDYLIVHELAHLHEPRHSPAFWRCVERAMPDYAIRKRQLAEQGAKYWITWK